MIILRGNVEQLKNSEFYDEECWDYPYEEIEMLMDDENYASEVLVKADDGRVYETKCTEDEIDELVEIINEEEREVV